MNINRIVIPQAETEYHKFEFARKIIIRLKSLGTTIVGYIESESSIIINIITRAEQRIQMK